MLSQRGVMMLNQDSENEIERMAKILCACKYDTCKDCMRQSATTAYRCEFLEQSKILVKACIGDKKQAVKEYMEELCKEYYIEPCLMAHGVDHRRYSCEAIQRAIYAIYDKLYGDK